MVSYTYLTYTNLILAKAEQTKTRLGARNSDLSSNIPHTELTHDPEKCRVNEWQNPLVETQVHQVSWASQIVTISLTMGMI